MNDKVFQGSANLAAIESMIAALAHENGFERQDARESLVEIGEPAVAPLIKALADPSEDLRWQAARTLSKIGSPAAGPALVKALEDEDFGVRWLAAQGLIGLKREGLVPLLEALESRPDSAWLREGAQHVLRTLVEEGRDAEVKPVLAALEGVEPALELPWAARTALDRLAPSRKVLSASE
jgi:HEAT repeat protein